jgi:ADP-ribose pyrophosphatase YjhB (NUDIX family)
MADQEYKNPTPVAVGLVRVLDGKVTKFLGVVRSIAPVGGVALPGGFVDELESFEQAVAREVLKETGFATAPEDWHLLYSRTTGSNRVLVFCELIQPAPPTAVQIMGGFIANDEVSSLVLLDETSQMCFPLHTEALLNSIKGHGLGQGFTKP